MKKVLALLTLGTILVTSLTGCGSSKGSNENSKVIKIAASPTPHAEILEEAKKLLKDKGYELDITTFSDYVQPNQVVADGEFDANYFQHVPFLNDFNSENKQKLAVAGKIHYEPFGIYPGTKTDLSALSEGDVIAIPNDGSNEGRALQLLASKGIITLKEDASLERATILDIAENPYNVTFKELEAAQIPRIREEVAFAIINGNYALAAGLSVTKDSVYYESSESEAARTYVNVIAVKEGNENSEKIQALVDVLKSDEIKQFIEEKYVGAVLVFEE